VREAAKLLVERRKEKQAQAQQKPERDITAPDQPEQAAPPQEEPAEPSGDAPQLEPEQAPPIEPPGSWTAEARQRFSELPPELQSYVMERENARDTEVRRRQQEVADFMRQMAPEQQAMMQARAQYEAVLPALVQKLQASMNSEFADIRTVEDVKRMASDDPLRYTRYDAAMKEAVALQNEQYQASQRQAQEYVTNWQRYADDQDRRFAEKVPEFSDPQKAEALQKLAITTLENDYGFSLPEMQAGWAGAFRDFRIQQMILDATRYRQLVKNKPQPSRSLPPVQRPGVARGPEAASQSQIQALDQQLDKTGNVRDAAKLLSARRRAGR